MKYIVEFKKTGVICFTSHLDILKVFKRSFKRAGIRLAYSQGFNPHPKMGFAQPLSLGYEGLEEYVEFETAEDYRDMNAGEILDALRSIMPEGLELVSIKEAPELKKTLASMTYAAEYTITIPVPGDFTLTAGEIHDKYMGQDVIETQKKQKKKKDLVTVNIKPKIRRIGFDVSEGLLTVETCLDSGSESNLSPELVITTLLKSLELDTERSNIQVTRTKIHFK